MTASAETHEVLLIIRSSLRDRNDMVDLLDRNIPSVLQALLAEWMLVDVSHPDLSPLASVPFMSVVATGEVVVLLLH